MEINLGKLPFDIDFHPSDALVTAGLISGDLLLYRYSADSLPQRLLGIHAHEESCRAARFINGGRAIATGSPDHSILAIDAETGSEIAHLENSHSAAVNRLHNLTESTIASGDDEGCIKVWDTRQRSCCNSFDAHEDYISDMTFASDSMKLLGTSGDGTLSVCDIRRNKVQVRSEFSEDELLSVVIMKTRLLLCDLQVTGLSGGEIIYKHAKEMLNMINTFFPTISKQIDLCTNGRKVICGAQTGTLLLYSWGYFKDCSDRFVDLSPNSVDALLKLDEDRVITGAENGLISLVGILPNKVIQPIAEHSEYPIERLAFSHDRKFLGSISHDQMLKLWDLDDILGSSASTPKNNTATADSDSDDMDVDTSTSKAGKGTKTKSASKGAVGSSSNNFFADL